MRVLTLNIWGLRGEWAARRAALRDGLHDLQPDLMALQETIITDSYDQTAEIIDPAYHILHQKKREVDGQGVSIVSRWPIVDVREVDLHVTPRTGEFACVVLIAQIDAPAPIGPLLFVNHFPNWQSDFEYERERQAAVAGRAIEEMLGSRAIHVVLAGDFTAAPDSANVRFWCGRQSLDDTSVFYGDVWERTHPDDPGHTFSPHNPLRSERWLLDQGRRIDYIFVRGGSAMPTLDVTACELAFAEPVNGVWVSDHFGVVADLGVPTARHD
jgi:endonuclease/exonuclease/phosphatase family metal-dependent hydrolase